MRVYAGQELYLHAERLLLGGGDTFQLELLGGPPNAPGVMFLTEIGGQVTTPILLLLGTTDPIQRRLAFQAPYPGSLGVELGFLGFVFDGSNLVASNAERYRFD